MRLFPPSSTPRKGMEKRMKASFPANRRFFRDVLPLTQSDRKVLVILAEFNNTQSNFEAAQFATLAFSEDDFEYVPGESHPSLRT